jgi:hypothetical protein
MFRMKKYKAVTVFLKAVALTARSAPAAFFAGFGLLLMTRWLKERKR